MPSFPFGALLSLQDVPKVLELFWSPVGLRVYFEGVGSVLDSGSSSQTILCFRPFCHFSVWRRYGPSYKQVCLKSQVKVCWRGQQGKVYKIERIPENHTGRYALWGKGSCLFMPQSPAPAWYVAHSRCFVNICRLRERTYCQDVWSSINAIQLGTRSYPAGCELAKSRSPNADLLLVTDKNWVSSDQTRRNSSHWWRRRGLRALS